MTPIPLKANNLTPLIPKDRSPLSQTASTCLPHPEHLHLPFHNSSPSTRKISHPKISFMGSTFPYANCSADSSSAYPALHCPACRRTLSCTPSPLLGEEDSRESEWENGVDFGRCEFVREESIDSALGGADDRKWREGGQMDYSMQMNSRNVPKHA